jgi:tRNA threonylcarbamoyladenosine biosynthesis protein TsaB
VKILGIDTSTACGSVGLVEDESILSEYLLNLPVTHSERLLDSVRIVLDGCRLTIEDLDGWAIALGPGSFTGLRIGVSTVKGLAFASRKPVTGVSTLDVLALQVSPTPYRICPVLDARKNELYTAFYRYEDGSVPRRESGYRAVAPGDLVKDIQEPTIFVGDGIKRYGDYFRGALSSLAIIPDVPCHVPRGSTVAILGRGLLREGRSLDLADFTPLYVRASEAEVKWQEKHNPDPRL